MPRPYPLVAICMATYEASRTNFVRQVESIRSQTVHDWHCWVYDDGSSEEGRRVLAEVLDDDARFTPIFFPDNVGFYHNFERGLTQLRGTAPWLALADQDDAWAPQKLERLLEEARSQPTPQLVYCDMEIRTADGLLVSPTYWQGRVHNETDLAALAFANTVSGSAALLSSRLLDVALPFPRRYGTSFHDHWLALVARVIGEIRYIDEALQTYVQHEGNAIGHRPGRPTPRWRYAKRVFGSPWWRRPAVRYYDDEVARLSDLARELLARTDHISRTDDLVLRALASLHSERPALTWMASQALREARDPSVTMSRRRRVLASVLWTEIVRLRSTTVQPS